MVNDSSESQSVGLVVLLLSLLANACAVPTTTEVEITAANMDVTDKAIVLLPTNPQGSLADNVRLAQCLRSALEERVSRKLRVIDTAMFQDALFPWFEVQNAPRTVQELRALLSRPLVRERIASLQVRYLISITGGTEIGDAFPGVLYGEGYGGAGFLGLGWEDKTSRYDVVVWDMVTGGKAGELSTTSSGRSVVPAFIIPFPFIAYTEKDACEELAAVLARLLYGPTGIRTSDP